MYQSSFGVTYDLDCHQLGPYNASLFMRKDVDSVDFLLSACCSIVFVWSSVEEMVISDILYSRSFDCLGLFI